MMMKTDVNSESFRILYYCSGWPTNIGNSFIDLGAVALLRQAAPQAQIVFASELPRWIFAYADKELEQRSTQLFRLRRKSSSSVKENALDMAAVTYCDLVVFAGMSMCEEFITVNGDPIRRLSKRGVPVLLLGTGAEFYSKQEQKLFGDFLSEVQPFGFIARDDQSFEMFAEFVPSAYKGIDCAFFLPEAYKPPSLSLSPYIVITFDLDPEPTIEVNMKSVIRAHHTCWGPSPRNYVNTERTLISDIPHDYLALYANASEVYSDRVHACAATLAYGRRARLYTSSPRSFLFDAVGAGRVREGLFQLDQQLLSEKKRIQAETVKQLIDKLAEKARHPAEALNSRKR